MHTVLGGDLQVVYGYPLRLAYKQNLPYQKVSEFCLVKLKIDCMPKAEFFMLKYVTCFYLYCYTQGSDYSLGTLNIR